MNQAGEVCVIRPTVLFSECDRVYEKIDKGDRGDNQSCKLNHYTYGCALVDRWDRRINDRLLKQWQTKHSSIQTEKEFAQR